MLMTQLVLVKAISQIIVESLFIYVEVCFSIVDNCEQ